MNLYLYSQLFVHCNAVLVITICQYFLYLGFLLFIVSKIHPSQLGILLEICSCFVKVEHCLTLK